MLTITVTGMFIVDSNSGVVNIGSSRICRIATSFHCCEASRSELNSDDLFLIADDDDES